tara:strand:+ start:205 stop:507 length:303 start_codon:yes stop_codon:yes gene_type:complete
MADENQITEEQLEDWVVKAYWYYLSEYAVPWITAETEYGFELGLRWIKSDEERIASAGWATLAYYAGVNQDKILALKLTEIYLIQLKKKFIIHKIEFDLQ